MSTLAEARKSPLREFDWLLFGSVFAILAVGLVFLLSTSYESDLDGSGYYRSFIKKQLLWVAAGMLAFFVLLVPSYRKYFSVAYVLYGLGIAGLVAVFFFGGSAHRWIRLRVVSIQPSEFMKIAFVLALGRYLATSRSYDRFRDLIGPAALTLLPMALIAAEPDLGMALLFFPVFLAMCFTAGARLRHLVVILLAGVLIALSALLLLPKDDYRRKRIETFILQHKLTQSEQVGSGYQMLESKIAVGSGGILGRGWGNGIQNRLQFLPERSTDFIFSVVAEEGGLVGAAGLLFLYLLVFTCGLGIANRTRETQGRLLAVGIVAFLAEQVFINAGMTVGIMPITGLTLPLVSYGGSSVVSSIIGISLLMNVSLRRVPVLSKDDFEE